MPAAIYDLKIEQGADYSKSLIVKNSDGSLKDLSNMTARLSIRQYVFDDAVLLECNTENSRILINTATSTVTIKIPNALTSTLQVKKGVYDLELVTSTSEVIRLIQGAVYIDPEVTR